MQIMWISGATGTVKSVSVTVKSITWAVIAGAVGLILLGIGLQFIGYRIALDWNPEILRTLGGVTTRFEQYKLESTYRNQLEKLQIEFKNNVEAIRKLEGTKNHWLAQVTPSNLRDSTRTQGEARGGPFVATNLPKASASLTDDLDASMDNFDQLNASAKTLYTQWESQLKWASALPTTLPLKSGEYHISSVFGIREDPFNEQIAMHEGIDFATTMGTPVMATGPGEVVRSGVDPSYGNVVEVKHIEGYQTRYAHLQKREVEVGAKVEKGQIIGRVGSTGRSTGPHLHYEVFYNGRVINPNQVMLQN
jgi:murein DD-endopeptidase MepM/ murein hydrolase activator NlpD